MHKTIKIKKLKNPLIQFTLCIISTTLLWLKLRATIFNRA